MRSRRSVLAAAVSGLGIAGCLREDRHQEPRRADEPADVGDSVPGGRVTVAQWTWADVHESATEVLDSSLATTFDVAVTSHSDRPDLESAVASEMSAGRPPASFQTVAGRELDRYAIARTIHHLDDIAPEPSSRRGVAETVRRDGGRYATPVTLECRNRLAVSRRALDEYDIDPAAIETAEALPGALALFPDEAQIAVPKHPAARFQLFCSELLATAGPDGFVEIEERAPRIGTIAPAVENIDAIAHRIEPDENPADSGDSIGTIGRQVSDRDEWVPLQWPGTAGTVSVSVTGFPFPKRSPNAHGTVELLTALSDPGVQGDLAALAGTVPAAADAAFSRQDPAVRAQVDWLEGASTVVPSPATGCGLDSDARARAIEAFADRSEPIDEFLRTLRDALS